MKQTLLLPLICVLFSTANLGAVTWNSGSIVLHEPKGIVLLTFPHNHAGMNSPVISNITIDDNFLNSGNPNDGATCHDGDLAFGVNVEFNTGTPPYTYAWTGNPAHVTFNDPNLAYTGAHFLNTTGTVLSVQITATVTDANGFSDSETVTVNVSPQYTGTVNRTDNSGTPGDGAYCFGDEATLEAQFSPAFIFEYSWSSQQLTPSPGPPTPLPQVTPAITFSPPYNNNNYLYTIVATDEIGCTGLAQSNVKGVSEVIPGILFKPACTPGDPDSITLTVTGGYVPVGNYLFDVGILPLYEFHTSPWTLPVNFPPGTLIEATVSDQVGCQGSASLVLPSPPPFLAAAALAVNATCSAGGSIDLTASGGTPGYTFLWSNGATGEDVSGLAPGAYSAVVTDVNGCTTVANATVSLVPNLTYYADADGDGFGDLAVALVTCEPPAGYVANPDDCDDNNGDINPSISEVCNNIDDNCNGTADEGLVFENYYFDLDGDGYGLGAPLNACQPPGPNYTTQDGDCNEGNAAINPGANESCNGIDDDCDGEVDEGVTSQTWYADADGDGYGDPLVSQTSCSPPAGYVLNGNDCDDTEGTINPGAAESCNGIDDDCDGEIDEGVTSQFWYADLDGDGYGDPLVSQTSCIPPPGYVSDNTDCNDNVATANPGAPEVCDGIDNNCDGQIDEGLQNTWYFDQDGDGYGNDDNTLTICIAPPPGYISIGGDCNDGVNTIYPGAPEICNGLDDNCDGQADENTGFTWYADADSDGYGDPLVSQTSCTPPTGYVQNSTDCDDTDSAVNPASSEVCNGIDDNCDGEIDENAGSTWYLDSDGDGYGNPAISQVSCTPPSGYVDNADDCLDESSSINPAATEVCNGFDDDCDGQIDESGGTTAFYQDLDGDSYGNPAVSVTACSAPAGYVADDTDCNDNVAMANPGAAEVCDGIDNNCDGLIDEGLQNTWYFDQDGDGFGNDDNTLTICIAPPPGYITTGGDCNDGVNTIYPGAPELCNGIDDNCDGQIDENAGQTWYADADGDGYGDATVATISCTPPTGYVNNGEDCDDVDAAVNPGSAEVCNGIDDDCDGDIDEGVSAQTWHADADGDSYGDPLVSQTSCTQPTGYVLNGDDCDDGNAAVNPSETEICNGLDDDCNGLVDDGASYQNYYIDNDGDGYGDGNPVSSCTPPGANYVLQNGDCNNWNAAVNPGATETCNWQDDDCDGQVDEGVQMTYYVDGDGDGFGNPDISTTSCFQPAGFVTNNQDCNDNVYSINPGAPEICDGFDNDCDGQADEGFAIQTYYSDNDQDGFGEYLLGSFCSAPPNSATQPGDCNDWNPAIYPGAIELCNWLDDDCDGQVDEGVTMTWYPDWDMDGYGDGNAPWVGCSPPNNMYSLVPGDCEDEIASIYPGAPEVCNYLDDDCDGQIDEGLTLLQYWSDNDHDGYGEYSLGTHCTPPANSATQPGDCNDWNPAIYPGATEVCNWQDDDCDGQVDEGAGNTWYQDADGDGYGNPNDSATGCTKPSGYVSNKLDCNDGNASIKPGATEVCNGIDDNCDGIVDNLPNKPDLIVLSANVPAMASPGATINVSGLIKNQGWGGAGSSKVKWYLSNDPVISSGDYSLSTWTVSISSMNAGGTKSFSKNIILPNYGWNGSKYLIFKADNSNQVNEGCFENNNTLAMPITIGQAAGGSSVGGRAMLFSAEPSGFSTELNWLAMFEQPVVEMAVERSADSADFQQLMVLMDPGLDANDARTFQEQDNEPKEGSNFYRIRFRLAAGEVVYSEVRRVDFSAMKGFEIFPNPASDLLNVYIERFEGKEVDLIIVNILGEVVYQQHIDEVQELVVKVPLDPGKFRDGIYAVSVIHKGRAQSKRLVVARF